MADLFVSYRRKNATDVAAAVAVLRAEGFSVCLDQSDVTAFENIQEQIEKGIAGSRAVLVWYSRDYIESRACQWELAAAWLANSGERVLVVNPESDCSHIIPRTLTQRQFLTSKDLPEIARHIRARLAAFPNTIGDEIVLHSTAWYPHQRPSSNRFVGRASQLWQIHDALSESGAPMLTAVRRSVALVQGFGGVGKTLLAEEYAQRFCAAWPGGIFWLNAGGSTESGGANTPESRDAERMRQVTDFALSLQLDVKGKSFPAIWSSLGQALSAGRRCLWTVDDIPSGLTREEFSKWLSPHPSVPTLVTMRERSHRDIGVAIDLDVLSREEAFELLRRHILITKEDYVAASQLIEALGRHSLALEVTGAYLEFRAGGLSIAQFLEELGHASKDCLEEAAEFADDLPGDHSPSILATLRATIGQLTPPALDFLCLASMLAAAPIPAELVRGVFRRLNNLDDSSADALRMKVFKQTDRLAVSRSEPVRPEARSVHNLVSRTARLYAASRERLAQTGAAAVSYLIDQLSEWGLSIGRLLRFHLEVTHARELSANPQTAEEALLLIMVGNTDLQRGNFDSAERLTQQALDYCLANLGSEHLYTWRAKSGLAQILLSRWNHAAACQILEEVVPALQRLSPPGELFRAGAEMGLAAALLHRNPEAARKIAEQTLADVINAQGSETELALFAMTAAAQIRTALSDFQGASALQNQVIEIRRQHLDTGDIDLWVSEFLQIQFRAQAGDFELPRDTLDEIAAAFEKNLGKENVYTLHANLLQLLARREEPAQVEPVLNQLQPLFGRILGAVHPYTLIAQSVGANARFLSGDYAGAIERLETLIPLQEVTFGSAHPAVIDSRIALATSFRAMENDSAAIALFRQIIPLSERSLGPDHLTAVNAKSSLAVALTSQEKYEEAGQYFAEALAAHAYPWCRTRSHAPRCIQPFSQSSAARGLGILLANLRPLFRCFLWARSRFALSPTE